MGHPIEIQAQQIRLHQRQLLGENVKLAVCVMQVVDDANVSTVVMLPQILADSDEVLRIAAPATVIVETNLATQFSRLINEWQHLLSRGSHSVYLSLACWRSCRPPDLRMQVILSEESIRLLVTAPEGEVLDAVLSVFEDFLLERRDMLIPPVVGDLLQAEFRTHRGAFSRSTFLSIERNNAPRHQIVASKQLL